MFLLMLGTQVIILQFESLSPILDIGGQCQQTSTASRLSSKKSYKNKKKSNFYFCWKLHNSVRKAIFGATFLSWVTGDRIRDLWITQYYMQVSRFAYFVTRLCTVLSGGPGFDPRLPKIKTQRRKLIFFKGRFGFQRSQGFQKYLYNFCSSKFVCLNEFRRSLYSSYFTHRYNRVCQCSKS